MTYGQGFKKTQKFLSLKPEESFVATFISGKDITNRFGSPSVEYTMEQEGATKIWECTQWKVADQMKQFPKGTVVKVARSAKNEKGHTTYYITEQK